jgi:hypothetical protein
MSDAPARPSGSRLPRTIARAVLAVTALAAVWVLIPWLVVFYGRYVPRSWERRLILGFLHLARWTYAAIVVLAPPAVVAGFVGILRA